MKALVTAIDADLEPRGEDAMLSSRVQREARMSYTSAGLAGSLAGCWSGPVVDEDCAERADQQVAFCLLDPVSEGVDGVAG